MLRDRDTEMELTTHRTLLTSVIPHDHSKNPIPPRPAYWDDIQADPKRIGFAFGGVEPGRLHAKGKCVEVHKLFYSIGRAGKYKLHVGLRQQAIAAMSTC